MNFLATGVVAASIVAAAFAPQTASANASKMLYPSDLWLPCVAMSIERVYRKIDDDRSRAAELHVDAETALKPGAAPATLRP